MTTISLARPCAPSVPVLRRRRYWPLGLAGAVGALLVSGATPPTAPPPRTETPAPVLVAQAPAAAALPQREAASPMDEPLRLIAEARESYAQVQDYACVLIKRERLRGQLGPENVMQMKVRSQPFSVYLKWQQPRQMAGQEACYVAGKNNGMMRVHATGLLGAVGWVSLDLNDARAKQSSNHSISEAGIGNLIDRFAKRWESEKVIGKTQVKVAEYEYNKRRCIRVETTHPDNSGGQFLTYRSVLYFDKESKLPIRIETYDWPRQGGDANGELMEVYSYVNLRLNVGLADEAFNY